MAKKREQKGMIFMYCRNCGNEISNKVSFCEFCGASTGSNEIPQENLLKQSSQTIINHLENAGILEKRIYELNKLISNITNEIENLRAIRAIKKEPGKALINYYWLWIFPIAWIIISLYLIFTHEEHPIMAIFLLYYSIFPLFGQAARISIILTIIPMAFNFVLNLLSNGSKHSKYKTQLKIRDAEYREDLKKAEILEEEKECMLHKKQQAEQYLKQVYSKNILFPKYQNMIAVLTIQEYFMSGRCNSLTGHEGAYNIYENELRQNIIINSLEAIQYSLEQIKQNQYMLYQAIQDMNSRIDSLSYEFSNISATMDSLENNSKISAYNSKIAADNTTVLSYIELSKY